MQLQPQIWMSVVLLRSHPHSLAPSTKSRLHIYAHKLNLTTGPQAAAWRATNRFKALAALGKHTLPSFRSFRNGYKTGHCRPHTLQHRSPEAIKASMDHTSVVGLSHARRSNPPQPSKRKGPLTAQGNAAFGVTWLMKSIAGRL